MDAMVPQPAYTKDRHGGWLWGNHPGFSQERMACIRDAVTRNKGAFAYAVADLPGYHGDVGAMTISVDDPAPVFSPPRRYSQPEQQVMQEWFQDLADNNIIKPAEPGNPHASAPLCAMKKDDAGEWTAKRVCIDYRKLNKRIRKDRYNLHRPDDIFERRLVEPGFTRRSTFEPGSTRSPSTRRHKGTPPFGGGTNCGCMQGLPLAFSPVQAFFNGSWTTSWPKLAALASRWPTSTI